MEDNEYRDEVPSEEAVRNKRILYGVLLECRTDVCPFKPPGHLEQSKTEPYLFNCSLCKTVYRLTVAFQGAKMVDPVKLT